ncbi:hypothetical protein CAOG_08038 [Capsaspora owczarzaki ATCC 30864]|uniref:hypothetical protein n=1 Tax=Capsaspora owczarzaki (strain ATCC 30864) TaxID=595528 RepID=UPI0003526C8A|nr:hypothetical protein CAOG_08038 [Capsaspora owczarzaki ATCC 30864]|eukprot:XP_004342639.2 hypothetical protein CAOG_08038 [Capsaspora owczarzaki ATCC 30864]
MRDETIVYDVAWSALQPQLLHASLQPVHSISTPTTGSSGSAGSRRPDARQLRQELTAQPAYQCIDWSARNLIAFATCSRVLPLATTLQSVAGTGAGASLPTGSAGVAGGPPASMNTVTAGPSSAANQANPNPTQSTSSAAGTAPSVQEASGEMRLHTIHIMDPNTPWAMCSLAQEHHTRPIKTLKWSGSGFQLISIDDGGTLCLWRMRSHLANEWYCEHTQSYGTDESVVAAVWLENGLVRKVFTLVLNRATRRSKYQLAPFNVEREESSGAEDQSSVVISRWEVNDTPRPVHAVFSRHMQTSATSLPSPAPDWQCRKRLQWTGAYVTSLTIGANLSVVAATADGEAHFFDCSNLAKRPSKSLQSSESSKRPLDEHIATHRCAIASLNSLESVRILADPSSFCLTTPALTHQLLRLQFEFCIFSGRESWDVLLCLRYLLRDPTYGPDIVDRLYESILQGLQALPSTQKQLYLLRGFAVLIAITKCVPARALRFNDYELPATILTALLPFVDWITPFVICIFKNLMHVARSRAATELVQSQDSGSSASNTTPFLSFLFQSDAAQLLRETLVYASLLKHQASISTSKVIQQHNNVQQQQQQHSQPQYEQQQQQIYDSAASLGALNHGVARESSATIKKLFNILSEISFKAARDASFSWGDISNLISALEVLQKPEYEQTRLMRSLQLSSTSRGVLGQLAHVVHGPALRVLARDAPDTAITAATPVACPAFLFGKATKSLVPGIFNSTAEVVPGREVDGVNSPHGGRGVASPPAEVPGSVLLSDVMEGDAFDDDTTDARFTVRSRRSRPEDDREHGD